jgi:transketolase
MINSIQLAAQMRAKAVEMSHAAEAAHLASALSCIDIIAVLYHSVLNLDPLNHKWEDRDRFILSKGHAAEQDPAIGYIGNGVGHQILLGTQSCL